MITVEEIKGILNEKFINNHQTITRVSERTDNNNSKISMLESNFKVFNYDDGILKIINKIENELDRKREIRWGPRTIDIDILIFSDKKINETDLIIPHKEMLNRLFVLVPLIEIYDGEYFEKEKIIERIGELVEVGNQKIKKL